MKVKIVDIKWGDRARKEYGGPEEIDKLCQSLSNHGLLHPIVIDDNNMLLAGGRRLLSATNLGWTEIECTLLKDLPELQKKEIELEENLHRKAFTYQEEVSLTNQIHDLKTTIAASKGEDWTVEDTASELGVSKATVQKDIALAKAIIEDPEIALAKNKGMANSKAKRKKSMKRIKASAPATNARLAEANVQELYHGPMEIILPVLPDNSVDLVLFDPPYGVEFENNRRESGHVDTYGKDYTDNIQSLTAMLMDSLRDLHRILKPGGHMYIFYAMIHHHAIQHALEKKFAPLELKDNKIQDGRFACNPLFWVKPSNDNPRPYERHTINYEPFMFAWKMREDSVLGNDLRNVTNSTFHYPFLGKTKLHPAQKPDALYRALIENSTEEGGVVCDPCTGSGRALRVAKQLGRKIVGIEKEQDWFDLTSHNVATFNEPDENDEVKQ